MGLREDIHFDWSSIDVKFAAIATGSLGAAGNADLVAAVTGKKIRALAFVIVPNATSAVYLRSGTTNLTGPMTTSTGVQIRCPHGNGLPYLQTAAGEALNLLNGANTCTYNGFLVYAEVD